MTHYVLCCSSSSSSSCTKFIIQGKKSKINQLFDLVSDKAYMKMQIIISERFPIALILGFKVRITVPPSNGKLILYRTISCALVDINNTKCKKKIYF
jgi:hypothetical protein